MNTQNPVHMPEPGKPFVFDESVAVLFDNMASRSIMGYEMAATVVERLSRQLTLPEFTQVWDMGTYTGRFLSAARQGLDHRSTIDYWGTDISESMIEQAQAKCPFAQFCVADLVQSLPDSFTAGKVGVVIWAYTLQFITDDTARRRLIRDTWDALVPGGAFFVFEKYRLRNPTLNRAMQDAYLSRRRENGYSLVEIEAKTEALKDAMVTWYPDETEQALRDLGATPHLVYRDFNFGGYVAFKGE